VFYSTFLPNALQNVVTTPENYALKLDAFDPNLHDFNQLAGYFYFFWQYGC